MSEKAKLTGNYFGTIYLTVISLLQGVALSQLVPNILQYLRQTQNPWLDLYLLALLLMLLIIFIVWHQYAIGIFFLRWFPNIIDTIIPFIISIGQFFLISYLQIGEDNVVPTEEELRPWILGYAIFFMIGSAGYFGAATRNDPELFTNIMSKQDAIAHTTRSGKYYMRGGYSVLFQGIFALMVFILGMPRLLYISFFFFLLHLILFEHFLMRDIKPGFIKALEAHDSGKDD